MTLSLIQIFRLTQDASVIKDAFTVDKYSPFSRISKVDEPSLTIMFNILEYICVALGVSAIFRHSEDIHSLRKSALTRINTIITSSDD